MVLPYKLAHKVHFISSGSFFRAERQDTSIFSLQNAVSENKTLLNY